MSIVESFIEHSQVYTSSGLGITPTVLNGKPLSSIGRNVQDALLLSPTIFLIVFATFIGRCIRSIALYGCQSGIRIRVRLIPEPQIKWDSTLANSKRFLNTWWALSRYS